MKRLIVFLIIAIFTMVSPPINFAAPLSGEVNIPDTVPAASAENNAMALTRVKAGFYPVAVFQVNHLIALDVFGEQVDGEHSAEWKYYFAGRGGDIVSESSPFDGRVKPGYILVERWETFNYPLPPHRFRTSLAFTPPPLIVREALKGAKKQRSGKPIVFTSAGTMTEISPFSGDRFESPGWPLWSVDHGRLKEVAAAAGIKIDPPPPGAVIESGPISIPSVGRAFDALLVTSSRSSDEPWSAGYRYAGLTHLVFLAHDWSGKIGSGAIVAPGSMARVDNPDGTSTYYYPVFEGSHLTWRESGKIYWDITPLLWVRERLLPQIKG